MIDDIRYGLRQLRNNPGFSLVAVLTLGLGIGASAAMFALIQGVLLSPPPYADAGRLVLVRPERRDGQPYTQRPTTTQWVRWRTSSQTLEAPALYRWTFNFLVLPDGSESLGGMVVSPNYFRVLGLRPLAGREFTDEEAARTKTPPTAIILGHDLWRRKFNSDPGVIGTTVRISRMPAPLPVVGVMPAGVRFLPDPGNASEPNYDVHAHVDFFFAAIPDETQPRARAWNVVTRLRPGTTAAAAQSELAAMAAAQAAEEPDLAGLTASVHPVVAELNQEGRRLLVPLLGSVALVFLIACGNVAGLLLAHGLRRQHEYAMRSALGAARWRLFRQVLTESLAVASVGALIGSLLAVGLVMLVRAIGGHAIPRLDAVSVGWPILVSGFGAAVVAALLAGVLPALRASIAGRFQALQVTRISTGRAERRLLGAVAAFQIVLTVALLAGAALLLRTAYNLASVRPGYETERILAMTVTSVQQDKWKDFHTLALERVGALPGITHAAFVWGLPLTGNKWPGDLVIVGEAETARLTDRLSVPMRAITPDYFAVMGMGLSDGRPFRSTDDDGAPRVAIVNGAFARRHLAGASPLGRKLRFPGANVTQTIEIVGVVADMRTESLAEQAEPEIYFPLWQSRAFSKHLVVRARADASEVAGRVRGALHAIDPTAAVEHVKTMDEIRRESIAPRTFAMNLLIAFALAATALALVGLYSVLSLSVGARTRELAVRQAVGAQRQEIAGLVIGEGFRLIAAGLAAGLLLAVLLGRALAALLYGVRPADPWTLSGVAVVFCLVGLAACAVPAWRGARVDLMKALRDE